MFTGIIRHRGEIKSVVQPDDYSTILTIATPLSSTLNEGDSVAVNGACLTVLAKTATAWQARLMAETIRRTNLGQLKAGNNVNLERPVTANQSIDGHFVQGHVDGLCVIGDIQSVGTDKVFTFQPAASLIKYLIPKGSIALDGVSLTVVDVSPTDFTVSIMPYTLALTNFGERAIGASVNMEVDMLGKYVHAFLQQRAVAATPLR